MGRIIEGFRKLFIKRVRCATGEIPLLQRTTTLCSCRLILQLAWAFAALRSVALEPVLAGLPFALGGLLLEYRATDIVRRQHQAPSQVAT